jgi:hypothetical protein
MLCVMALRRGLGPLGHKAIADAAEVFERLTAQPENPAALSLEQTETDVSQLNWLSFDSSRVAEAAYDPANQRLYVRFIKPVPEGTPWEYDGVTPSEWRNFRRAKSAGRYVNRVLNYKAYHRGTWD